MVVQLQAHIFMHCTTILYLQQCYAIIHSAGIIITRLFITIAIGGHNMKPLKGGLTTPLEGGDDMKIT